MTFNLSQFTFLFHVACIYIVCLFFLFFAFPPSDLMVLVVPISTFVNKPIFLFFFFEIGFYVAQATCGWITGVWYHDWLLFYSSFFVWLFIFVCTCVHAWIQMLNGRNLVSFHDLGPKDQTWLIRFGAKQIYPWRHLAGLKPLFLDQTSLLAPWVPYI